MSNKRDLKAFVRFDGSGRIVAGSLILRKKKPKVGKWYEIQAYECCNYVPTTTTTTSTSTSTTTTTTTAAPVFYNADRQVDPVGNPCNGTGQFNIPLVFSTSFCSTDIVTLTGGYVWSDFGLVEGDVILVKDPGGFLLANVTVTNIPTQGQNGGCSDC